MASDIILENDQVLVEGGDLKIEKSVHVDNSINTKGLIVSATGRYADAALRVQTKNNNNVQIPANVVQIGKNDDSRVRVKGKLHTGQLTSSSIGSPTIQTSSVKIGSQSHNEGAGKAGILILINEQGDEIISLNADNETINVKGVGDLVQKIQTLEEKIENLEQQIG